MHRSKSDVPAAAELVLRGGVVHALDDAETTGSAIAVRGGRVAAVGDDRAIAPLIDARTRIIELDGRGVIPGINDSHLHASWLGALWPRTVFDVMEAEQPIVDPHAVGHSPRLIDGTNARRAAILKAGEIIASFGITSYTEPGLGPGEDDGATGCFGSDMLETYRELDAEGALTARVNVLALFGMLDGPSDLEAFARGLDALDAATPRPEWLRITGVKIFADGIPPQLQAWTDHRYPDGSSGTLLVAGADLAEQELALRQMIRLAHHRGHQVGVHATGDRAIETVVSAVAEAEAERATGRRHYIIHGDLITEGELARMAALGMGLNIQAGIAVRTSTWVEGVLGEAVASAAWPIGAALDAGVPVSLSSDAPILTADWREGVAAADAWMGASRSSARMRALLRAYTVAPALQDGAEAWKGTLEPGKVADLCVLEADPLGLVPAELPDVSVELTVVGGNVVFERTSALA